MTLSLLHLSSRPCSTRSQMRISSLTYRPPALPPRTQFGAPAQCEVSMVLFRVPFSMERAENLWRCQITRTLFSMDQPRRLLGLLQKAVSASCTPMGTSIAEDDVYTCNTSFRHHWQYLSRPIDPYSTSSGAWETTLPYP